jgi:hypothetical protein
MEVSGQLHAPTALPPGKSPRYPLYRLGGPQSRSEEYSYCCYYYYHCGIAAVRPRNRGLIPDAGVEAYLFRTFRPAVRTSQPPIEWVLGAVSPGCKAAGAWKVSTLAYIHCQDRKIKIA